MASHLRLAPTPARGNDPVVVVAGAASPIRVVLADDHALMRRTLRQLLDNDEGVEVIAEADDLASAADQVDGRRPQVLVLDLGMSDGSSVEAIGRLRERNPATQIVVLTM